MKEKQETHMKKGIIIGLLLGIGIFAGTQLNTQTEASRITANTVQANAASHQAIYLTMRDGVRIAIDVYLPALETGARVPTVLEMTRYRRSTELQRSNPAEDGELRDAKRLNDRGYARVVVDARGSGASFGNRQAELSDPELEDYSEVLTWIAAQSWSNGRVGASGISYLGDTAELITSLGNPVLTATAPGFTDYDAYEDVMSPGGVFNVGFGTLWFTFNNAIDEIKGSRQGLMDALGIPDEKTYLQTISRANPVDGPDGLALRDQAIGEHQQNANGLEYLPKIQNKDDQVGAVRFDRMPYARRAKVEASNVPMLILASWQDAGTTTGTLSRLTAFNNHQEVHIGSWTHGGETSTDPFLKSDSSPNYSTDKQFDLLIAFFDRFVKGNEKPKRGLKSLAYYTQGEGVWHQATGFPKTKTQRWYLGSKNSLATQQPNAATGSDTYNVNFDIGMGETTRWRTQFGGTPVVYPNLDRLNRKHLVYTSAPIKTDLRVTGMPRVSLEMSANTADGAIYAYLEDVAPDGKVTMIGEGLLRLVHRKIAKVNPDGRALRTPRTYAKVDQQAMPIGKVQNVTFDLIPTSTLFKKGHQIRVAFAGHDKDQFQQYGTPGQAYTLERNKARMSFLELPVETR
jgi:uncharacterized protein